jgi:hypothetical protein
LKAASREPERATPKHVALSWARRLKRVFGIEIEQCARCGGRLKVLILDDRRRTRAVSARAAGSVVLDDAEGAS